MNWPALILGILFGFAVIILSFIAGRVTMREEMKKTGLQEGIPGPPGPEGPPGPQGARGDQGPPAMDDVRMQRLDELWRAHSDSVDMVGMDARLKELENRDRSYQDRFKRVEKKAGMSV